MRSVTSLAAIVCMLMIPGLGVASPIFYFATGHTGAQTQIDIDHSSVFYSGDATPPVDGVPPGHEYAIYLVDDFATGFDWLLGGAHLLMKAGNNATATVTFSIFEDSLLGTLLNSVTLTHDEFCDQKDAFGDNCQTFGTAGPHGYDGHQVAFNFTTPVLIMAGHHYIALVSSDAPDVQTKAYFIKGATDPVTVVDGQGCPPNGNCDARDPLAAVPEPATWLLMAGGLAAAVTARRRRIV